MDKEIKKITPKTIYTPSEKVVPRVIKDKLIIVPIEDGVANFNDAMFSFNETGTRIWECIEKKQSVEEICSILGHEYNADMDTIEKGVVTLVRTLLQKGIIETWKS